jgi:hypothetical protein
MHSITSLKDRAVKLSKGDFATYKASVIQDFFKGKKHPAATAKHPAAM